MRRGICTNDVCRFWGRLPRGGGDHAELTGKKTYPLAGPCANPSEKPPKNAQMQNGRDMSRPSDITMI
jgi:hypothetical protein